jgi:acetyl-CoA C-acetyltransferase
MVEELRRDPGSLGLVSGVGMHMNKHVFAAYSTEPGALVPPDDRAVSSRGTMDEATIVETFEGPGRVATYSVVHGRDGAPDWAALVCDLPPEGGAATRCYARLTDAAALVEAEDTELVGRPVELVSAGGHTEARL